MQPKNFKSAFKPFPKALILRYFPSFCSAGFSNHLPPPLLSIVAFLPLQIGKIRGKGESIEGQGLKEDAREQEVHQEQGQRGRG